MISYVKKSVFCIFCILLICMFCSKIKADTLNYCAVEKTRTFGYLYCDGLEDETGLYDLGNYYIMHYQTNKDEHEFYIYYSDNGEIKNGFVEAIDDSILQMMCPSKCKMIEEYGYYGGFQGRHFECEGTSSPISKEVLEPSYTFFHDGSGNLISLSYMSTGSYQVYKNGSFAYMELKDYFEKIFLEEKNVKRYWKLDDFDKIYYIKQGFLLFSDEFYSPFDSTNLNKPEKEYDVIFNSGNKIDVLYDKIDDWIKNTGDKSGTLNAISQFENKYSSLIKQCDSINKSIDDNKSITLDYDIDKIIDDLTNSSAEMNEILANYTVNLNEDYVLSAYDYSMKSLFGDGYKIGTGPDSLIKCDIQNYLNDKGIGNITGIIKQHLSNIATCTVNLQNNLSNIGAADKSDKIQDIKDEIKNIIDRYDVAVIIDCEDLIGEELREKLNEYMFYARIIVPIIIIILGSLDLVSAVLASDEDKMRKAQAKFIKRLMIGVAIFFVPTVINLILDIFNSVWSSISTDTCGF